MKFKHLPLIILFILSLCADNNLLAQKKSPAEKEEIVITEHAAGKNSIFKLNDTVKYSIDLKSTYKSVQDGQISYAITDFKNHLITKSSLPVSLPAKGFKQVQLNMPAQKSGFYKVSFMLNVTDDDDTVRRVFGVDTGNVVSPYKTPDDFWQFWDNAKTELAKVDPKFKMTFMPNLSKGNDEIYLVEMQSLGNITVRAWLTMPKDRKPGQKFAVAIAYPGYGGEMHPFYNTSGMIHIGLNIRGLGNSRDVIHPTRDGYIDVGIEDKDSYIFKGVMMDCIRLNDFLATRPEVDQKSIFVTGGSLGGYLSMVTASLDDRVALCSGDNPGYPDIRAMGYDVFPINTMKDYADRNHFDFERSLKTWDYYSLKAFVTHLKCPVVMGIGLLDNFIAPAAEMHVYNNIPSSTDKKLFIFPNLAHEVGPEQGIYVGKWVYDKLHIYEKWLEYNKPSTNVAPVAAVEEPNADVITLLEHPLNKGAIFSSSGPVNYTVDLKSNFKITQTGKISYVVTTPQGKLVAKNSLPVSVLPNATKTVTFEIPAQSSGFYHVNFMINTSQYDDTLRRAFGVDTNKIVSTRPKPADFDAFWDNAKAELAKIAPNFKVTEKPDLEHNDKVYLVEMQSLDNLTIRGYMSLPNDIKPGQKLPVCLYLPGYGAQAQPMYATPSMALISLSVRGQPLSDDVLKPEREDYITTGIEDKNKYILRGALMDCERLVDFVSSRPELDHTAIYASGASMGGYLALALSGIDKRITIASANNPVFSDFRALVSVSRVFPIYEIYNYATNKAVPLNNLLNNLDYFDLQNFAPNITAQTVVGIGMLDNFAPPTNSVAMFNNMPGNKKLFIFPTLAHEVGPEIGAYTGRWVYEKLNIWNRYLEYNKQALAAKAKEEESGSESVAITGYPGNKEAVFKGNSVIDYNVDFKNNFFKKQTGMFTYLVYTSEDQFIRKDSVAISIEPRTTKRVHIEIPPQKTGFYKINFAINVADYDDTLKRVFGVDIENIHSTYPKPADFDQFWANTKKELAAIPPNFKMTEKPELETGQEQIYLIEMQSLGNITVRAWLTLPRDRKPKEKFPVNINLPGYGAPMTPAHSTSTFAVLSLNVRGHGNSRDVIHPEREEYITYNLEDKNKYIYRGSIMDGVRLLDFVYAHKELFDTESIYVTGASQGGYLTLCLASLDQRVTICEADNPGYIDLKMPYYNNRWPISFMRDYGEQKSVKFETLINNFEYFNLKSFVPNIKCKVIVGIGLLDPLVPPTNELIMYNNIKAWKKLFIYPNLTHEVGTDLAIYKAKWVADNLGF